MNQNGYGGPSVMSGHYGAAPSTEALMETFRAGGDGGLQTQIGQRAEAELQTGRTLAVYRGGGAGIHWGWFVAGGVVLAVGLGVFVTR